MKRLLLALTATRSLCQAAPPFPAWDPNGIVAKTAQTLGDSVTASVPISCAGLPKPSQDVCYAAVNAEYRYVVSQWNHRAATFEWQLFSSKLLFWLVTLIVIAGVVLTYFQFRHAFSRRPRNEVPPNSELEFSLEKVRVSSSVVGVVILTLSLGFYFLYLVHVYPIKALGN